MLIVAERINSSRKNVARAIEARDEGFIQGEARKQTEAGADYIDVNAGAFGDDELDHLKWVAEAVQEVTDLPLAIDSPDPAVIDGVLPLVKRAPMINSITLEPNRLNGILPLVAAHKARVIGLCQSEDHMAETIDDKVRLAGQLAEGVTKAGIPLDDLYIDPLVYPLATHPQGGMAALAAMERIMAEFPGVHTICGLTNISYGLPERRLINRTFLTAAISRGLDAAILDPTDTLLYAALKAGLAVAGRDDYCMDYIAAFREARLA
jgi:5-methyltetrahydrofolate corrinoid/iron sulfur protein methyltransferase